MKQPFILLFAILIWSAGHSQNFEWLYTTTNSTGRQLDLDNQGNLVVVGVFKGTAVDFDLGAGVAPLSSEGTTYGDLFVMKVNPSGDYVWAHRFGGPNYEFYSDITVDDQNFIYTTGNIIDSVNFLPTAPIGYSSTFVQKLDPSGNQIWARSFDGTYSEGDHISVDSQGNVYLSGTFRDSVDFDPGVGEYFLFDSIGAGRFYIAKLDSNGNFQWAQTFGSSTQIYLGSGAMMVDQNDDVVLAGYTHMEHDFDPGPGTLMLGEPYADCGYVIKLDGAGNLIWGKDLCSFNSDGRLDFLDITIDPSNNIALMGDFQDSIDFDPGLGENVMFGISLEDMFIVNLSENGDFNWSTRIGTSTSMPLVSLRGKGVTSDGAGNVFFTGYLMSPTDFDGGATDFILGPDIGREMFIAKYNQAGEFNWVIKTEGDEQTSPAPTTNGFDIRIGQNGELYTTGHSAPSVDFDPGPNQYYAVQQGAGVSFILSLNQFELGIDESEIGENFVYPNPTMNYIHFEGFVEQIRVLNLEGKIVAEATDAKCVDLSLQPSGIYTLLLDGKPFRIIRH